MPQPCCPQGHSQRPSDECGQPGAPEHAPHWKECFASIEASQHAHHQKCQHEWNSGIQQREKSPCMRHFMAGTTYRSKDQQCDKITQGQSD